MDQIGRLVIMVGAGIMAIGFILYFFGGAFGWVGNTPLDFSYKSDKVKIYFPIGTMLIISVVVSLLFRLLNR